MTLPVSYSSVRRSTLAASLVWLVLASDGLARKPESVPPEPATALSVPEAAFEAREIKTTVEPGVTVVDLCYEFKNTGDFPLAVEAFSHSCGCMTGEWEGKPIGPGATGKIRAKFLTAGLRGKVRKSLRVRFLDLGTVELVAEVTIPEAITYSAQTLRWVMGEEPRSQRVDVVIDPKSPLRVLSVSGNDPAIACELQTPGDDHGYRIIITPRDTDAARICVLQVRTDSKDPRDAVHGLFALVEKPREEAPRHD